jgi:hypothetical protein
MCVCTCVRTSRRLFALGAPPAALFRRTRNRHAGGPARLPPPPPRPPPPPPPPRPPPAVLQNPREHAMVRHEAAEALGAIADPGCVALLRAHAADAEPIVAHSCVVALDVLEHEASGAFEYCAGAADAGSGATPGAAVEAH